MEKKEARREAVGRIAGLSRAERRDRSEAACVRLLALPEVERAQTMMFYAPLPDELDVWPAIRQCVRQGRRIVLPKCVRGRHDLIAVAVTDFEHGLAPGTYCIAEPVSDDALSFPELEVIVLPGRAFDPAGNRIGRGAGYYDHFLTHPGLKAFTCGVVFECQVFPAVPVGPHDVPVEAVVTESGVRRRSAAG